MHNKGHAKSGGMMADDGSVGTKDSGEEVAKDGKVTMTL